MVINVVTYVCVATKKVVATKKMMTNLAIYYPCCKIKSCNKKKKVTNVATNVDGVATTEKSGDKYCNICLYCY